MKFKIAKTSGFCVGVRRAVNIALDVSSKTKKDIYTFGPLIHNPQVLKTLKKKGIGILEKIPEKNNGTVIIRAHGVPPSDIKKLKQAGCNIINATCPKVVKVQAIIRNHTKKNYATIIIGNKNHPEVRGLLGYAKKKGFVALSLEELKNIPKFEKAIIVAQTTQSISFYEKIKKYSKENNPNYKIFDTICDSTEKRQNEINNLSKDSDLVLVVGGKKSGNTKRLYEIAKKNQKNSFHIETISEIDINIINSAKSILIAAGASTPNWIIKQVSKTIEGANLKARKDFFGIMFKFQRFLLSSCIYLAFGAGSLTYAFCKLQGINNSAKYSIVSICYVLFIHILNNFSDLSSHTYNNPEKAMFYKNRKLFLQILSIVSFCTAVFFSITISYTLFVLLLIMTIPVFAYKIPVLKNNFLKVPASKTITITAIWATLTTIFPVISNTKNIIINPSICIAFFCSITLVFARTSFFDILDIQGDKIAGKETLPMIIGEKKTFKILNIILFLSLIILFFSSSFSIIPLAGYFLSICPAFLLIVLFVYNKRKLYENVFLEFLIESNFILAGLMTFLEFYLRTFNK